MPERSVEIEPNPLLFQTPQRPPKKENISPLLATPRSMKDEAPNAVPWPPLAAKTLRYDALSVLHAAHVQPTADLRR